MLFITTDDLDWSLMGFMGHKAGITPNLDRLASASHRIVNNRAASPICQPSRQAMMTGMIPHRSGGIGFVPVDGQINTLTTALKGNGYFTAGIHKLQHMQPPTAFPWDFMRGGSNGNFLTWDDRNPVLIAEHVRDAIGKAKDENKPFFINCNITDPHRPFYGSSEAEPQDSQQQGPYRITRDFGPDDVVIPPHLEDLPDIREELLQYYRSSFRADMAIGNILSALKESGADGDTLILFLSDHGMPLPFAKGTCHDYGTRTPALISWPGMKEPGTFSFQASNIDVLPTILDILGVPQDFEVDGRSWLPVIEGAADKVRDYNFTYMDHLYDGRARPARAIHDDRFVLIFAPWANGEREMGDVDYHKGLTYPALVNAAVSDPAIADRVRQCTMGIPLALYDLTADPGQRVNLIHQPAYRERTERMQALLRRHMQETGDPQTDNFERLLRGERPVVSEDRGRYRHYNWIAG
ncbi:sulfatase [Sphingomonas flavalba]|uniref:sulfatase family protein n=1 Tax=Sphingomonas flavalba TaxID=2559804 RepID=UPI0039E14CBF